MKIPLIPQDKANHAIYGALAFIFNAAASGLLEFTPQQRILFGLAMAALLGAAKEFADWIDNHTLESVGLPPIHEVSPWDFLATVGGGAICALAYFAASWGAPWI